jgi:hypothetical protein
MQKYLLTLLSLVIFFITRLFHSTYRYRYSNGQTLKNLKLKNQNFVFAIWHQQLFAGILAQTGHQHIVIVSKSKDAAPVAFTCKMLGHLVVRGSSRKGNVDKNGKEAKEEMIEKLKLGHPGAVTVDGPKGPALKVKPGIIDMAKNSNAYLVPYVVCSSSFWQFKSWDSFRLPKPFSKILVSYGEPIIVNRENDTYNEDQNKLETALNALTEKTLQDLHNWKNFSPKNWWEN